MPLLASAPASFDSEYVIICALYIFLERESVVVGKRCGGRGGRHSECQLCRKRFGDFKFFASILEEEVVEFYRTLGVARNIHEALYLACHTDDVFKVFLQLFDFVVDFGNVGLTYL